MGSSNPAGELMRLTELYRQMSDGELLKLAHDTSELTEAAQQAIAFEMSQRRLQPEPVEPPRPRLVDDPGSLYAEDRKLMNLQTVWCREDALRIQNILDPKGIPFCMGEEKADGVEGVTSNFAEGVNVYVMRIGYALARDVLGKFEPSYMPEPEKEESRQLEESLDLTVRCPKCKSEEVIFDGTPDAELVEDTSPSEFSWTCTACGNKWKDGGIESFQV